MLVVRNENLTPKSFILSFNEVPRLKSIKVVSVCHLNKFIVAFTPCSLVSSVSEIGIPLLAILTDNFGIVVLVINEEILRIFVDIDVNFGQSIVERWFLNSFIVSRFKPLLKHSQFTFLLEFINKFRNWAHSDRIEKLFNVNFITVKLNKSSQHFWSSVLIDFEQINFNKFVLSVAVQVPGKLINKVVHVTEIN